MSYFACFLYTNDTPELVCVRVMFYNPKMTREGQNMY